jgi:hypothetical protein
MNRLDPLSSPFMPRITLTSLHSSMHSPRSLLKPESLSMAQRLEICPCLNDTYDLVKDSQSVSKSPFVAFSTFSLLHSISQVPILRQQVMM